MNVQLPVLDRPSSTPTVRSQARQWLRLGWACCWSAGRCRRSGGSDCTRAPSMLRLRQVRKILCTAGQGCSGPPGNGFCCHSIMNCTGICPMGLNLAKAKRRDQVVDCGASDLSERAEASGSLDKIDHVGRRMHRQRVRREAWSRRDVARISRACSSCRSEAAASSAITKFSNAIMRMCNAPTSAALFAGIETWFSTAARSICGQLGAAPPSLSHLDSAR